MTGTTMEMNRSRRLSRPWAIKTTAEAIQKNIEDGRNAEMVR